MMQPHSIRLPGAIIGLCVALLCPAVFAITDETDQPSGHVQGSLRKLGRGIANVATSPLELVRTTQKTISYDGYWHGLSFGVVQGIGRTVMRAAAGAFEIATFLVEFPEGFGPLMQPEFVFDSGPTWRRIP